jgi:flagellar hook-length control protein FliK
MVSHTQNTIQAPVAASTPTIATTLQDSRWPQEFSDRIVWIAKNDQQVAQINITPAQLGPVQITVNINGDQASINFASPHAEVRKAIEDAMPNLREMLASSGISLGQSNVGSQLQQQQRELPGQFANGSRSTGENAILPPDSRTGSNSSSLPIQRGRGLVDLFA